MFPKPIDHIDGGRAAQDSCTNLHDRVDLFDNHEMGFVLRIKTSACKFRETETDDLTGFQRQ
jgi:hypothetical protein